MSTYRVTGTIRVPITIDVPAEKVAARLAEDPDYGTAEQIARELADEMWPGLTGYAGNGARHGRLIGHDANGVTIEVPYDDSPDWGDEVEVIPLKN